MREKTIEKKLRQKIKQRGGLCLKFTSPGTDGVPDRIILLPNGRMAFAETKAPGRELRPLQKIRKRQLERLGFKVYVVDDVMQIQKVIDKIGGDA